MPEKLNLKRLLAATLLSPLALPVGLLLLFGFDFVLGTEIFRSQSVNDRIRGTILYSLFGIPIALCAVLVLGIPLHLSLRSMGIKAHWPYILAGLMGGFVFGALLEGIDHVGFVTMGATSGLVVAATFSFIVNRDSNSEGDT